MDFTWNRSSKQCFRGVSALSSADSFVEHLHPAIRDVDVFMFDPVLDVFEDWLL